MADKTYTMELTAQDLVLLKAALWRWDEAKPEPVESFSDEIAAAKMMRSRIHEAQQGIYGQNAIAANQARRVCHERCPGGFSCTFTTPNHTDHRCDLMGCVCNEGTKPTAMCATCGRTEFDCDAANDCTGALWPVPKQDAKGA